MKKKKYEGVIASQEQVFASPFDNRDYELSSFNIKEDIDEVVYPVNFRCRYSTEIYNQKQYPMCVGFTLATIKEIHEIVDQQKRIRMSPGFIYLNRAKGDIVVDGMIPRQALNQLQHDGVCSFEQFPYLGRYMSFDRATTPQQQKVLKMYARTNRIKDYFRIHTLNELKYALTRIGPCMIVVPIDSSWTGIRGAEKGVIKRDRTAKSLGYHAMVVVGWKDERTLIIQNSWGKEWGDGGYCYIDYYDYPILEIWGCTDEESILTATPPKRTFVQSVLFRIKIAWRKVFRK